MKLFKTSRFEIVHGGRNMYDTIGYLKTTELAITAADADSATGAIQPGKLVDNKANSESLLKYGSGYAIGFITEYVTLNGTKNDEWFKKLTLGGYPDTPVTRGLPVSVVCPFPGLEAIFEGAVDISSSNTPAIDGLVVKTGTGAIATNTAINSDLSCINGCWKLAAAGDFVLAHLRQANLTPNNSGEIRIRVRFCSPHLKVVDTDT